MRRVGELTDVTPDQVQLSRREYRRATDALAPFKRILDVYVSQWFGNGDAALEFLKSDEAEAFIAARGEGEAPAEPPVSPSTPAQQELRPPLPEVARTALAARDERRFFHWELEFPEVWYGPRPDAPSVVAEKDNPGFDAVVGNPPYDELSEDALGREIAERGFLEASTVYGAVGGGRLNWYHYFLLQSLALTRGNGCHSFIVPMSLLADQFTRSIRLHVLGNNRLRSVEAFPQKDDPGDRVFKEAKLPTCVYVAMRGGRSDSFRVRVHPGKDIRLDLAGYLADLLTLQRLAPENVGIPLVTQGGWELLRSIAQNDRLGRLHDCGAAPASGEIVFNKAFRPYLTEDATQTLILRGSHVQRWEVVDEAKQGAPLYLRKERYVAASRRAVGEFPFDSARVVYQECAAIDNWRRVIAAHLPEGNVCGHKICYFRDYKCSLMALLAVFNSRLIDWLVTVLSTNNSLPAYLVGALPFPAFTSTGSGRRAGPSAQACELYAEDVAGGCFERLLASVDDRLAGRGADLDVVHDLLAHLAQVMTDLNKQKQAEMKRFLGDLEARLKIEPKGDAEASSRSPARPR